MTYACCCCATFARVYSLRDPMRHFLALAYIFPVMVPEPAAPNPRVADKRAFE